MPTDAGVDQRRLAFVPPVWTRNRLSATLAESRPRRSRPSASSRAPAFRSISSIHARRRCLNRRRASVVLASRPYRAGHRPRHRLTFSVVAARRRRATPTSGLRTMRSGAYARDRRWSRTARSTARRRPRRRPQLCCRVAPPSLSSLSPRARASGYATTPERHRASPCAHPVERKICYLRHIIKRDVGARPQIGKRKGAPAPAGAP